MTVDINQRKNYFEEAFIRNRGLLSQEQQQLISKKAVGIAGVGGVGGLYAISFARAGFGKLILSDLDRFEVKNMNRQYGAMTSTIGKSKVDAVVAMVKDINPFIEVEIFPDGITEINVKDFVNKSDIIIDGVDFYCIETHRLLHTTARELNKRAIFSAPLGCSATLQIFDPSKMSFEDYFDFKSCNDFFDKMLAFAAGCAPKATHLKYLKFSGESVSAGSPASLVSAVNLCSGLVINSTLMYFIGSAQDLKCAPHFYQFDARRMKLAEGNLYFGNRGWLQRLKIFIAGQFYKPWRAQINAQGLEKGGSAEELKKAM